MESNKPIDDEPTATTAIIPPRSPTKQQSQQRRPNAALPETGEADPSRFFIWRTRSLDEVTRPVASIAKAVGSIHRRFPNAGEEEEEESTNNIASVAAALHTSFDAAFLDEEHRDRSIFRRSRFLDTQPQPTTATTATTATLSTTSNTTTESWDESDPQADFVKGRKHVRQPSFSDAAGSLQPEPGTVRKQRRRAVLQTVDTVAKTPVRPKLPQGSSLSCWKKNTACTTPSSATRRGQRRMTSTGAFYKKSPMVRVPPSTPRDTTPLQRSDSMMMMMMSSSRCNLQQLPELMPFDRVLAAAAGEMSNTTIKSSSHVQPPPPLTPSRPPSLSSASSILVPSTHVKAPNRVSHNNNNMTMTTNGAQDGGNTTTETDSVGTISPAGATFRFTSFPASLPRVNHPRMSQSDQAIIMSGGGGGNDDGVPRQQRPRRITDQLGHLQQPQLLRDDDGGTHNTSMSSLSGDHVIFYQQQQQQQQHPHPASSSYPPPPPPILEWKSPVEETKDETTQDDSCCCCDDEDATTTDQLAFAEPVHSKLFLDEDMYGYSDDDDDNNNDDNHNNNNNDDDSADAPLVRGAVGRTRLDFNLVVGKEDHDNDQEDGHDYMRNGPSRKALFEKTESIDLARPIEQKRVSSFPSSVSSSSPLRTLSGCDEVTTASTSALTPCRSGVGSAPTDHPDHPGTPRDVQLHFQLSSAQCSPIFGIPDENEAHTTHPTHMTVPPNKDTTTTSGDFVLSQDKSQSSNDSRASTGSHKMRRHRPMPDMSAFDNGGTVGADRSGDDHSATAVMSRGQPSSPRLLCPPTPVRTPAWAHNDSFGNGLLPRANSLIISKVLATCPPRVLDKRSSLEISLMDEEGRRGPGIPPRRPQSLSNRPVTTTMRDDDSEVSTVVGSPESPVSMEHDDEPHGNDKDLDMVGSKATTRFPFLDMQSPRKKTSLFQTPRVAFNPPPLHSRKFGNDEENAVVSFALDFETLGELGRGTFADVYKVRSRSDHRLYAVKRNRRQFRGKRDRDLALAEVQTMQRLQNVCNDEDTDGTTSYSLYLLFFYRAWQEDGHFFSQTELCCRDTCREMIQSLRTMWPDAKKKYPSLLRNLPAPPGVVAGSDGDTGGRLVPNVTIWKICHDIAAGLSHIHSHGIVHNDIKPSNIFFVEHSRFGAMCKIGDFGMAGDIGTAEDGQEGDTMYMPPELLSSVVKQPGIDIFSFGLTLYELASSVMWELPADGPLWHRLRSGKHDPDLPTTREPEMVQLVRSMIDPEPRNRPSAEHVLNSFPAVKAAGNGFDIFLRDYLLDVESFDRIEEQQRHQESSVHQDQTPRNALTTDRRILTIRSPDIIPLAPLLFSPNAVS